MAKKDKKGLSKKVVAMNIFTRLNAELAEYHSLVGEKKFVKHLKKTSKLFANDIADATKKEQERLKKEAKKTTKKVEKQTVKKNKKVTKKAPLKKTVDKKVDTVTPVIPETPAPEMGKPVE